MKSILFLLMITCSTFAMANTVEADAPKICRLPLFDSTTRQYDLYLEEVSIAGNAMDAAFQKGQALKGCMIATEVLGNLDYMDKQFAKLEVALSSETVLKEYEKKCGMTKARMDNLLAMTKELRENNTGIIQVIEEMASVCRQ